MKKPLIVYYSWSCGNTERIAKSLQSVHRRQSCAARHRRAVLRQLQQCGRSGAARGERGFAPELKPLSVSVADYDVIAVGTPTWWYTMAPAVKTFLRGQNFAGKTVVPFMTNGGWPGRVIKDMKAACPGADFACDVICR